ncbi:hypothetical protein RC62_2411 [Flavobacterium aquidurense]|uniref:Transposase n=1 Tax=Flavobacterium aquidurense TaxID=362413 RepID=A0A0Q0VZB6_9FLAO|nr:hypothetical protein RC62_2411 [Flavobacterium aquidurense]
MENNFNNRKNKLHFFIDEEVLEGKKRQIGIKKAFNKNNQ